MSTYQIADGHDNEASFAVMTPQPAGRSGQRYPELVFYGNGQADFEGGLFMELSWDTMTRAQYNTLRTQLGISDTVASNDVTVKIRQNDNTFDDWNATLIYLRTEQRRPDGWRGFSVRLINMVAT